MIIAIVLGIVSGMIISSLAKEELVEGKKYFNVLFIASALGALGSFLFMGSKPYLAESFVLIGITSLISYVRSYKSKF